MLDPNPAEHERRPVVPTESPLGLTHLQFGGAACRSEALLTFARDSSNFNDLP